MSQKTLRRFYQSIPFCVVAGVILIFLMLVLYDTDGVVFYMPIALAAGLGLLICAVFGRAPYRLATLLALIILCVASFVLFRKGDDIHAAMRWALWSKHYKAAVLAQPVRYGSELKHVEWDSWGWAMTGGAVYVVFDPSDALDKAAESSPTDIVLTSLPHAASKVRRLEKSWYSVTFYTEVNWDD